MKKRELFLSSLVLFALSITGCRLFTNNTTASNSQTSLSVESSNNSSSLEDSNKPSTNEPILSSSSESSSIESSPSLSSIVSSSTTSSPTSSSSLNESSNTSSSSFDSSSNSPSSSNSNSSNSSSSSSSSEHTHTWSVWTQAKAATCTEAGSQQRTCSGCGQIESNPINALGHNWDNGVITTPATEEAGGVKTFTCQRCHITKTESIPALPRVDNYDIELSDVANILSFYL